MEEANQKSLSQGFSNKGAITSKGAKKKGNFKTLGY